jgi:hypothetical protein
MAGADEDFGSEVGEMLLIFLAMPTTNHPTQQKNPHGQNGQLLIQLSKVHMHQMILSEASIIIIWTYQDMMEWKSRIIAGEMTLFLVIDDYRIHLIICDF